MEKWLVTGATGLLGANAVLRLAQSTQVVGTARARPLALEPSAFLEADISSREERAGLVERSGADVILHAAAISSIEACAANPELARVVNVEASEDLAAQAKRAGAQFILISTDAVFDGEAGNYREIDPTSPTTEYGRSKVAAEQTVLAANADALVARVNFYGWSPTGRRSLAEFFHRNLAAGLPVKGFTDVTVSTLYVEDLVDLLAGLTLRKASDLVHVVSSEAISKFEFGRLLAVTLGYSPDLVSRALSTDVLEHARGSNLSLDTSRLEAYLGSPPPGQVASLAGLKRSLNEAVPSTIARFAHGE